MNGTMIKTAIAALAMISTAVLIQACGLTFTLSAEGNTLNSTSTGQTVDLNRNVINSTCATDISTRAS